MAQTTQGISVIICAYTEERWIDLLAAIESVRQQSILPQEIIVVIDHNPPLLQRMQEQTAGVIVVENSQQKGLSGARNSGVAVAQGALIAFLDDDAVASKDWLMRLTEGFRNPHVQGVGGAVTPNWVDGEPAWFPEEFHWVVGCTYRGMPQRAKTIRNPIGANMVFRRRIFDTVGGFRSEIGRVGTLPVGCEETELCIRARQRLPQSIFLYESQASVSHRVPSVRASWRYFCSRCYSEGLTKALVAQYVGAKDGLTSERTYTFHTLPQGVIRCIIDGLFHLDRNGFLRAGAIVIGLVMTIAGYLIGSTRQHRLPLSNNIAINRYMNTMVPLEKES